MVRLFVLFVLLGIGLATFLFQTSYEVHELSQRKVQLHRDIRAEKEAHRLLQAEWMHLNDPERLQVLTEKLLPMKPTLSSQIKSIDDIPMRDFTLVPNAVSDADMEGKAQ